MKKKTVRDGSWKDPVKYIQGATRTYEYQNEQRSYIGFRCVRSYAGSNRKK
jgi:formylglycine-generating enzyme required for sulfatase activity